MLWEWETSSTCNGLQNLRAYPLQFIVDMQLQVTTVIEDQHPPSSQE